MWEPSADSWGTCAHWNTLEDEIEKKITLDNAAVYLNTCKR